MRPSFALEPLATLAGLGSAFLAGLAYTVVRHLKGKEHPRRIVFYFSLVSTVAMVPLLIWNQVTSRGLAMGLAAGHRGCSQPVARCS